MGTNASRELRAALSMARVWPIKASRMMPAIFSPKFYNGSPKASTRFEVLLTATAQNLRRSVDVFGHHYFGGILALVALRKPPLQVRYRKCPTVGGTALIRATLVRALVLSAAFAGSLTAVQCLAEDGNQLPTQATKELSPRLLLLLQQKNMPKLSPILVRIFKEESELEVWKQDTAGQFQILKVYPICRWSGDLGPKVMRATVRPPRVSIRLRAS